MAKDAKGHGSNAKGGNSGPMAAVYTAQKAAFANRGMNRAAEQVQSDQEAARALASGPKSAPAPVHDAMKESHDRDAEWVRQRGGKPIPTPAQSENSPFKSRLGRRAGHSYLDPHDLRAKR